MSKKMDKAFENIIPEMEGLEIKECKDIMKSIPHIWIKLKDKEVSIFFDYTGDTMRAVGEPFYEIYSEYIDGKIKRFLSNETDELKKTIEELLISGTRIKDLIDILEKDDPNKLLSGKETVLEFFTDYKDRLKNREVNNE